MRSQYDFDYLELAAKRGVPSIKEMQNMHKLYLCEMRISGCAPGNIQYNNKQQLQTVAFTRTCEIICEGFVIVKFIANRFGFCAFWICYGLTKRNEFIKECICIWFKTNNGCIYNSIW